MLRVFGVENIWTESVSRRRKTSDTLSTLDYACKFLLRVLGMQCLEEKPVKNKRKALWTKGQITKDLGAILKIWLVSLCSVR